MWYKEKVVRFYDLDGNLIEVKEAGEVGRKDLAGKPENFDSADAAWKYGCHHMNGKIQA